MNRFEHLFVWTGGGLFVLSLAVFAYSYLIRWETSVVAGGSWEGLALDVTLFTLFALHHSVLAREGVKHSLERAIRARLLRSFYVWTASLLLLCVLAFWQRLGGTVYEATGWQAALHASAQLAGVALIAWSVARIDPLELAGIRPAAGKDALQIMGPYRWVRHPLYLGWLVALFGAAHMTTDRLVFAAVSAAYLFLAVPWEERSLIRAFGEPYTQYQRQVPWRILPYIY